MSDAGANVKKGTTEANGIEFAYHESGKGPLALLLHGFPDTPVSWHRLIEALADAGYRAVAPFMRGYAPTGTDPEGVYQAGALASDACALHEALGGDGDAVVIGHDWGAMAAYGAASLEPDRWSRVVGAAVPPGQSMAQGLFEFDQIRRSWYMFFFQHPLADLVVPASDLAFLARLWAEWSPGHDPGAELAAARESLADPANLAAALGYYRATLGSGPRSPRYEEAQACTGRIPAQPTLYLHGIEDGCIGIDVARRCIGELGPGSRMVTVEGAGHFLQVEQPELVDALILDFLAEAG